MFIIRLAYNAAIINDYLWHNAGFCWI